MRKITVLLILYVVSINENIGQIEFSIGLNKSFSIFEYYKTYLKSSPDSLKDFYQVNKSKKKYGFSPNFEVNYNFKDKYILGIEYQQFRYFLNTEYKFGELTDYYYILESKLHGLFLKSGIRLRIAKNLKFNPTVSTGILFNSHENFIQRTIFRGPYRILYSNTKLSDGIGMVIKIGNSFLYQFSHSPLSVSLSFGLSLGSWLPKMAERIEYKYEGGMDLLPSLNKNQKEFKIKNKCQTFDTTPEFGCNTSYYVNIVNLYGQLQVNYYFTL